jgi:MFS transporter, SP family, solute carrier family 2 (facilitated glucose transporter), member 3
MTCKLKPDTPFHYGLPTCIPMSDSVFSAVTAVFTLGGLVGSMGANILMDRHGRKGATRTCAVIVSTGATLMGFSSSVLLLGLGR